jgi:ketosteroid isomerase-like protein
MRPEDLMQRVTRAFAQSDVALLFESLDDDIVWHSAAIDKTQFRFGGIHRGRAEVIESLSQMATALTFVRFEPKEIVASGDVIWGLFDTAFVPTGKDQPVEYPTALRFRLRNGRIVEVHAFFDTAFIALHLTP